MSRAELLAFVKQKGYERRSEPFTLSSGGESRDYVDLRRAVAAGADLEIAAREVANLLEESQIQYDVIGGMTMGADPVAHGVALVTGKAWFSVRKAAKDHGRAERVEGAILAKGVRAVVFEDTISTGRSILEALEVVSNSGAEVVAAVTLLLRGEGPRKRFDEVGIPLFAVLTYRDLGIEPLD